MVTINVRWFWYVIERVIDTNAEHVMNGLLKRGPLITCIPCTLSTVSRIRLLLGICGQGYEFKTDVQQNLYFSRKRGAVVSLQP